jgi:hypothetical protein
MLEYDPHPPFHSGAPELAPENVRTAISAMYKPLNDAARAKAATAKNNWSSL